MNLNSGYFDTVFYASLSEIQTTDYLFEVLPKGIYYVNLPPIITLEITLGT
jgi:hypothetical protein